MAPKLQEVENLDLADCRLADSKPATTKRLQVGELPTSMPQIVVREPEPILYYQKLFLLL